MDLSDVSWRKSSYSTSNGGNCVEVGIASRISSTSGINRVEDGRHVADVVAVRDSKEPDGPVLAFSPAAWQSFTSQLKTGELDLG